ncbi:hypothetical protein ACFL54_07045 [Planctomycetota bacterium]
MIRLSTTAKTRPGIILVMVLGVLALLSVMAITFVSMTRLERSISQNYVDKVRTQLIAESGIDFALQQLYMFPGGSLSPENLQRLGYQDSESEAGDLIPSFASPESTDPQGHPVSGAMPGTYRPGGDFYKLKVTDNSGKLNINEINSPIDSEELGTFGRMFKLLTLLGDELFLAEEGPGVGMAIAYEIMTARDKCPGGFSTLDQVRQILRQARKVLPPELELSDKQIERLLACLTVHTWVDQKTLKPTFQLKITDWEDNEVVDDPRIYKLRFMQTRNYELEPRAPVNVNTASLALLTALIAPLQGWYLAEGPPNTFTNSHYGRWNVGRMPNNQRIQYDSNDEDYNIIGTATTSIPFENDQIVSIATAIYDRIRGIDSNGDAYPAAGSNPNPFETWDEFRYFINEELDTDIFIPLNEFNLPSFTSTDQQWWLDYHAQAHKDLLIANFNPNSRLNDFNPNQTTRNMIDKGHLISWTTEFCFEPTGYFDIESYGYLIDNNNQTRATNSIAATVKCFEFYRLTTQADFLEDIADVSVDIGDFITEADNSVTPTAGADLGNSYNGATLQTYPEPLVPGRENIIRDSVLDGSIALATYQEEYTDADLYVPFDQTIKPVVFTDSDQMSTGSEFTWGGAWPNHPNEDALTSNHDSSNLPGSLYPDGAISEVNRILSYRMSNLTSDKAHIASVMFWIKPAYHPGISGRVHRIAGTFSGTRGWTPGPKCMGIWYFPHMQYLSETVEHSGFGYSSGGAGDSSSAFLPSHSMAAGWELVDAKTYTYSISGRHTGSVHHDYPNHDDTANNHGVKPLINYEGYQWNHISWAWSIAGHSQRFYINGYKIDPPIEEMATGWVNVDLKRHPTLRDNIDNYLSFGTLDYASSQQYMCDATIDEFAVYPIFIDDGSLTIPWQYGRYLSEQDATNTNTIGTYTSPPIPLHKIFKSNRNIDNRYFLRSCSWTFYHPRYNRGGVVGYDHESYDVVDNIRYPVLNINDKDDPLANHWNYACDPIAVDIFDPETGDWYFQNDKTTMMTYAGGSPAPGFDNVNDGNITYNKGDEFRFKVYFNLNPGQLLYDTPVLDDITFTFHRAKPKILSWISNIQ